jgi:hypothetical protein
MYDVSYSGRVIDLLRELIARNPAHAARILTAVRDIDHRLRIYPQFGQPLRDLSLPRATLWIGSVAPLVVHYVLVEADDAGQGRQVIVVRPFTPFAHSEIV